jgi:hypothetical protein
MIPYRAEHRQKSCITRAVYCRGSQDGKGGPAMLANLAFTRQLALAIVRNGPEWALFLRRILLCGRTSGCQARYVNQASDGEGALVDSFHKIACPALVHLVILCIATGLGATSTMDYVSYAFESLHQGAELQDRARSRFRRREVRTNKALIARRSDQVNCGNVLRVESVQDMTADKPGGACDQNFQSGQAEFLANLAEFVEGKIDLRVGVCRHQADAN